APTRAEIRRSHVVAGNARTYGSRTMPVRRGAVGTSWNRRRCVAQLETAAMSRSRGDRLGHYTRLGSTVPATAPGPNLRSRAVRTAGIVRSRTRRPTVPVLDWRN